MTAEKPKFYGKTVGLSLGEERSKYIQPLCSLWRKISLRYAANDLIQCGFGILDWVVQKESPGGFNHLMHKNMV